MIQNYLVFCVDAQAKYVQGSIPVGKLTANDINRNSIWVISPFYPTGIVRGSFQTKDRVIEQVSSTGLLRNDKISIDELVPTSASYYELVKDWNIWEIRVPQRILEFLSHHRTSEIGISFNFTDYLKPTVPSGITYIQDIIDEEFVPVNNGYYVIKIAQYEFDEKTFHYNDILVKNGSTIYKLNRLFIASNTPTVNYLVDPAIPADNYETVEPTLTDDILATLNEQGVSIYNLSFTKLSIEDVGDYALMVDGSNKMLANIDVDFYNINNVNRISVDEISSNNTYVSFNNPVNMQDEDVHNVNLLTVNRMQSTLGTEIEVEDKINMSSNKIENMAKGTSINDGATIENLDEYITISDVSW